MEIFQRLNVERGITILLITHEMDIAEYGTRLVRFRDGRIQVESADHEPPQRRARTRGAPAAEERMWSHPARTSQPAEQAAWPRRPPCPYS